MPHKAMLALYSHLAGYSLDYNHTCPLSKVEGGLNLLHEANDDAVVWLASTASAAFAK